MGDLCKEPKPSKQPTDSKVGACGRGVKIPMALLAGQPKNTADLADTKVWFAAPHDYDFCETKKVTPNQGLIPKLHMSAQTFPKNIIGKHLCFG